DSHTPRTSTHRAILAARRALLRRPAARWPTLVGLFSRQAPRGKISTTDGYQTASRVDRAHRASVMFLGHDAPVAADQPIDPYAKVVPKGPKSSTEKSH